jgi:hypothetical protein
VADKHAARAGARSSRDDVSDEARRRVERWFAARGVPQLIEGYSSEPSMDARAVPLIGAWLVVGTVLIWLQRPDGSLAANIGAMLVALVATGLVLGVFLWCRKHPPFRLGVRLDVVDIAVIGLVPGILFAVITGDPGAVLGIAGNILLGIGIIYVVVALGLPELIGWALRHLRENLPHIATLVARTLPLLLILVVFLLFAAELWQAAQALGVGDLVAVMALLAIVGGVLVVTQARAEIRVIEERGCDRAWNDLLAGTPVAELGQDPSLPPAARPLRPLERLNLVVLMLISQMVQSLFVALMVALFLIVLGMLVVPAAVQDAWAGAPVRALVEFVLLGEPRTLSLELLIAAALLGGMCGLYFTGLALTDPTYRAESSRVIADIEQIMAVRSVYLSSVDQAS